jgi:F-type H+-transporting ATPase subunit epsilon
MAIPDHLTLEIVTPERSIAHGEVDEVVVPGAEGSFGVLPGHTPFLTTLSIGEIEYRRGDETSFVAVSFGFAEVLPDRVTILAQIAEASEEIDVTRAEAASKRAQERLDRPDRPAVEMDYERARLSLLKSLVRLQVATRARHR